MSVFIAVLLPVGLANGDVVSSFSSDADGWNIADCNYSASTGTNYNSVNAWFDVVHNSTGGNPGGYIDRFDPTGLTYMFNAPSKFLGNKSAYRGGTLSFDLKSTYSDWTNDNVVVLIGADPAIVMVCEITMPPTSWSGGINNPNPYSIDLVYTSFKYNSKSGSAVTQADFNSVMADLSALRISAEYGQGLVETSSLDSVSMTPEPVTLAILATGSLGLLRRRKH
ncbi:MAG: PEP-CTERM sorting domain-containing protein [Phycisphaerae bacterium]|nr:PEP-CTERM sorting domain-containing protein [Phycisphaerae bacterium]